MSFRRLRSACLARIAEGQFHFRQYTARTADGGEEAPSRVQRWSVRLRGEDTLAEEPHGDLCSLLPLRF